MKNIDKDNLPLFISFSGGETSGFMLYHLLEKYKGKRDIYTLFANTGQENEETLNFVNKCNDYFDANVIWIEAKINQEYGKGIRHKIVDFDTADRNGGVFEQMIKKLGIVNTANPFCTRDLKKLPMEHYLKSIGVKKYHTAIGIRADEIDRIGDLFYPLVPLGITKKHINYFWDKMPFRLELKGYQGNCKWCYKKSLRKHLTILNENPEFYDFPKEMEKKYGNYINPHRLEKRIKNGKDIVSDMSFFRDNTSTNDLIKLAKGFTDFALDDSVDTRYQMSILNGFELDISNGCIESCEIY